ncbi:MAG: hypothetical protein ACLFVO_28500, partial [Chloroflexaceae bacterium]
LLLRGHSPMTNPFQTVSKYSYSFLRDKETSVNTLEKFITEDNKSVEDIVNLKNSIEALEEPD